MKEGLTKEQIEFLKHHELDLEDVFNARGLTKAEYGRIMKQRGIRTAFNTPPCPEGHTLTDKRGRCIQCNTVNIGFANRYHKDGCVYIAGSIDGELIKIGFTDNMTDREESLNRTKYANLNDWKIILKISINKAADIENICHGLLDKYKAPSIEYYHDKICLADEVFNCSYNRAKDTILEYLVDNNYKFKIDINIVTDEYKFRNLIKVK
jgi:hypothetical protein